MPGNHTSPARLLEHAWPSGSSLTLRAQPAAPEQPLAKASSSPVWGTGATEATLHQAMPVSCPLCSSRVLAAARASRTQPQLGPSAPLSALWTRLRPGLAGSRLPPPGVGWDVSRRHERPRVCGLRQAPADGGQPAPAPLDVSADPPPRSPAGSRGDQALPYFPRPTRIGLRPPRLHRTPARCLVLQGSYVVGRRAPTSLPVRHLERCLGGTTHSQLVWLNRLVSPWAWVEPDAGQLGSTLCSVAKPPAYCPSLPGSFSLLRGGKASQFLGAGPTGVLPGPRQHLLSPTQLLWAQRGRWALGMALLGVTAPCLGSYHSKSTGTLPEQRGPGHIPTPPSALSGGLLLGGPTRPHCLRLSMPGCSHRLELPGCSVWGPGHGVQASPRSSCSRR
ncbi:peroxisomal membrane protein 11C isoform X1 [Mustela erminea]|uniref:peroxisomal membrane protein 11C isoform X1 n=1 Tax=Mustela erminea TaxID=36723 RepID=UPI0013870D62|nr:peroxisomal membrane protein 11C isoform X1 [Mustela erminea]